MNKINVLSLFDGMSCGQLALKRANILTHNYYAAEIDREAIKVTQQHFPNTNQLGSVTEWKTWELDWSSIDLLIGGSPCQGFSFSGKQLAFDDPRSKLFFTYVDILNHIKKHNNNVKFLLENVKMNKVFINVINDYLKTKPLIINSNLVSAQNRERIYWCNWEASLPIHKNITVEDILDKNINNTIGKDLEQILFYKNSINHPYIIKNVYDNKRVVEVRENERGFRPNRGDYKKTGISEIGRIVKLTGQTDTITTSHAPKVLIYNDENLLLYRSMTPLECERLQTLPDNYTESVKKTHRLKMIGNGWTVDVISHLLSSLKI